MSDLTVRAMTRPELDLALDWAAKEGWNPGLHDAEPFWAADPDGFVVALQRGQIVGVGAIVSYDGRFGCVGLYIIRADSRKRGLGRELWKELNLLIRDRLLMESSVGLNGVVAMQPFYEKSGYKFHHVDRRVEGVGQKFPVPGPILPAARVSFANLIAFDAEHFPAPRPKFLAQWIKMPGSGAFAHCPRGPAGKPGGYAVVRKCRNGFKIGPLFARDDAAANDLFQACSNHAAGQPLFLDVPETNAAGLALAAKYGMKEVFACARMYQGTPPKYNEAGVYGITTMELG